MIGVEDVNIKIEKLKSSEGSDIQVWGSSMLIQLLLQNDKWTNFG